VKAKSSGKNNNENEDPKKINQKLNLGPQYHITHVSNFDSLPTAPQY